ncbi:hypothetical protein ACHAW6_000589 [Cyclotella cf. meneghiniana]
MAANDQATHLIHLTYDGNFQLETNATVLNCRIVDVPSNIRSDDSNAATPSSYSSAKRNARVELQLDQTTMHPQGGGQPTDIGSIQRCNQGSSSSCCSYFVQIDKVTIDRVTGIVTHLGLINSSENVDPTLMFPPLSPVIVSVDAHNRRILSECHTAGHVVDAAMTKCDAPLPPVKGYHFMDGPYVEYAGSISDKEGFLERLKKVYLELIDKDIPTSIQTLPLHEASSICNRLAQNFNVQDFCTEGSPNVRVVTVAGYSCPCGGTHVCSTGDLKERGWCIKGLRCKKGVVRVRYGPRDC